MKKIIIMDIICVLGMLISIGAIVGLFATESSQIWVLKYTPGFSKEKLEEYLTEQNELHQDIYRADSEILVIQTEIDSSGQEKLDITNNIRINNWEIYKINCKQLLLLNSAKNTFLVCIIYGIIFAVFLSIFCVIITKD